GPHAGTATAASDADHPAGAGRARAAGIEGLGQRAAAAPQMAASDKGARALPGNDPVQQPSADTAGAQAQNASPSAQVPIAEPGAGKEFSLPSLEWTKLRDKGDNASPVTNLQANASTAAAALAANTPATPLGMQPDSAAMARLVAPNAA